MQTPSDLETRRLQDAEGAEATAATSPVAPATADNTRRRRVAFGSRQDIEREQELRSTGKFLDDGGMLEALTSIKDVMSDVISHMNRNTAAIVEIGNTISSLGSAVQAGFQEARDSGKDTTGRGQPMSEDLEHGGDLAQGEQREQEGTNSAVHQLGAHTAFKVYSKALQSVTVSKPGDGNFSRRRKPGSACAGTFPSPKEHTAAYSRACSQAVPWPSMSPWRRSFWTQTQRSFGNCLTGRLCNASHRMSLRL